MKKIITLILLCFLLTGCYDNIELNNLAIITGIGIDYKDDNFYLTYEILNDIKTEENTAMKSYVLSGQGKSISEAFINTNYKVGKKPYYAHLKVVLLSENVIKNNELNKIVDYFLRDTNIRDEFLLLITKDVTPKDILKHNSKNTPVISDYIINLIDNEKYNNNLAIDENYQFILAKLMSKDYDTVLGGITINNEDEITLDNFVIFKDFNYKNTLSKLDSSLYNLLSKNVFSFAIDKYYDNKNVTIGINHSNTFIKVLDDEIKIDCNLEGKILENAANLDLETEKTYKKLNEDFAKILESDIKKFVLLLQDNESDILGFQQRYYQRTRKKNNNLWLHAKVNVNVDLKINTKGFIFEVKE